MPSEPPHDGLPLDLDLLVQMAIDDNRPTVVLDSSKSHTTCLFKNPAFEYALAHVPVHALEDWLSAELSSPCAAKATPATGFANREWIKKKIGASYVVVYCKHDFVIHPVESGEYGSLDCLVHDWIRFPSQVPISPWIRYLLDYDWSKTDIGALSGPHMCQWPAPLQNVILTFMHTPRPRIIYWGPQLIQFYNESAAKLFGSGHPASLGNKQVDTWGQEMVNHTSELIRSSWEEGQSVHNREKMMLLDRDGFPEESYFDWFLLPFTGPDGRWICSVCCFNEVTSHVVQRNRDEVSFKLLEKTTHATDLSGLWFEFLGILDEEADDVAYTLLYTVHEETVTPEEKKYHLFGSSGLRSHEPFENPSSRLIEVFEQAEGDENVIALTDDYFLPELGITMPDSGTVASAFVFTMFDAKGSAQGTVAVGTNPRRRADTNMKRFIYSLSEIVLKAVIILQSPSDQRKLLQTDDGLSYRIQLEKLSRQLSIATLKNEKNQETFSRMAEDAPIGMFVYKIDGTPVYLNDRFLELLGEEREEYFEKAKTGFAWRDCIHPDDEDFSNDAWKAAAESRQVQVFQFRVKASKTSPTRARWLEVVCFPQCDENDVLVTVQGYLTDVTSKKLSEALTTERMNAAIETKRKAQNFIDMISHEMRNPLSSIIQLTESVLTISPETLPKEVFDTVADAAHTINICALHMKVIIDEVLDFSKLDSNLLVLAPERTRPREIIEKAIKMFDGEMKSADIQTDVEELPSDCSVGDVLCDPSRLLQIIINLITNALKFTRKSDTRRITLAYGLLSAPPSASDCGVEFIKPRKKGHDDPETVSAMLDTLDMDDNADDIYLLFSVKDTGCGLTPEESQVLFHRFSQASPKTYQQYGGSGLGLFISRELVELQRGQIGLHSEAGVGSKFCFYIRAKRAVRISRTGSVASVESTISVKNLPHTVDGAFDTVKLLEKIDTVPQPKTLVKDMHILLVEDNMINSKVMSKQLRKLGCEVHTAENGLEALNYLATTKYFSSTNGGTPLSMILLDVEMPIMDGLTCIRRIRALEQSREISGHVPVIAITANARNEQIANAIEAGMDSVVTKPFTIKDLVPQMEALVDAWSGYG